MSSGSDDVAIALSWSLISPIVESNGSVDANRCSRLEERSASLAQKGGATCLPLRAQLVVAEGDTADLDVVFVVDALGLVPERRRDHRLRDLE